MFGISPTKNKMAIVCQSRGSPRPYLYGSRVQNMQRHARIYTGPAGRGLMLISHPSIKETENCLSKEKDHSKKGREEKGKESSKSKKGEENQRFMLSSL